VPSAWVEESTQDKGLLQGLPINYGYMWWGENCNPSSKDYFAMGNLGQFIYVSPVKNLIIVRNGERYGLEGEGEAWGEIFCQAAKALP
jgi:CubicO group peptidase (beta-lactamase class C family)